MHTRGLVDGISGRAVMTAVVVATFGLSLMSCSSEKPPHHETYPSTDPPTSTPTPTGTEPAVADPRSSIVPANGDRDVRIRWIGAESAQRKPVVTVTKRYLALIFLARDSKDWAPRAKVERASRTLSTPDPKTSKLFDYYARATAAQREPLPGPYRISILRTDVAHDHANAFACVDLTMTYAKGVVGPFDHVVDVFNLKLSPANGRWLVTASRHGIPGSAGIPSDVGESCDAYSKSLP